MTKHFGGNSTHFSKHERWVEEYMVRSWDSGNQRQGYEAWLHRRRHEQIVPNVEGWLEGHPSRDFHEWEDILLSHVEVVDEYLRPRYKL